MAKASLRVITAVAAASISVAQAALAQEAADGRFGKVHFSSLFFTREKRHRERWRPS